MHGGSWLADIASEAALGMQARTCRQLQSILEHQGAQPVMQQLYEAYLLQRLEGRKRMHHSCTAFQCIAFARPS